MFKRIIEWIYKKTRPEQQKNTTTPIIVDKKFLCSLNFELGFDGFINIQCYWPDLDTLDEIMIKRIADQYAKMIYAVDSGLSKKDIIETLYDVHNKNNPYDIFFVQEVLDKWVEYYDNEQSKNFKPLIKPSNVFKQYK
jgi:hypothetical protein